MNFRLYSLLLVLCVALLAGRAGADPPQPAWSELRRSGIVVKFTEPDRAQAEAIGRMVTDGRKRVERFFGKPFPQPFTVLIFPDRDTLTAFWRADWKAPDLQPERWMVGSGTAQTLSVLTPRVWKTQAAEHNPDDKEATARLLTHELVHVYHGQKSPHPDFVGMDDITWFAEGLAVYASGQLEGKSLAPAKEAVEKGLAPRHLKDAWSGKYRYGVSGSLVRYLDRTYGRAKIITLLGCTTETEILTTLGLTETELLTRWQEAVRKEK